MYFKRFFQTGSGGSDPRDKTVAVYKCDACKNEEWYVIPHGSTFMKEPRVCPKCHSMGVDDLRKNLETRRDDLKAQEENIKAEIEKVISELARLEQEAPR